MENETGAADFEASDTVDDADADEGEGPPIKSTVEPQIVPERAPEAEQPRRRNASNGLSRPFSLKTMPTMLWGAVVLGLVLCALAFWLLS